jgi:PKD repeat protein
MTLTVDNLPATANAGTNITIKQNETAMLNGSASTDNTGIVNYTWTYKVGSTNFKLFNKTATTQKIDPIGVYTVTLNVTDTGGWLSTAVTHINVTDGYAPVVDAGKNISVFQTHPFMLNGSLTTDNVDTVQQMNFTWTYNDTVKNITLYGPTPTSSLAKINVYKVKLVVKDRNGNIGGPAYVWVNVTDGFSPVANAGSDITVKQLLKVTFNGSASQDNVGIVNYTWNFTNKGTAVKLYGKAPSYIFDTIGKYNVTLTVKDAAGLTGKDLMVVTVVDGIRPVVKAGTDMVDEVDATFNFNGSGSSDNVGIVKYNWSFGDGTYAQGRIVAHSYGKVGPYKVVLTCTDAQGNSANASLNVTVIPKNHPPTIKSIPDMTAIEGVSFTKDLMSTYVNDVDTTDILNFSLTGAPAGMTINSNTGKITWIPATNQDWKTYHVVLFVSDGKAKVNSTFNISVIAKTIGVKIGPIKDKNGNVVKDAQVSLMMGADTSPINKTDSKGMTTIFVSGQWASKTVDVKVHKAGYNDKVFTGTIANDGTFTPINGYPKIEAKQTQDYTFLIIVIVVLLVLALVLFSMKRPSEEEDEEEETKGEEALSEEE